MPCSGHRIRGPGVESPPLDAQGVVPGWGGFWGLDSGATGGKRGEVDETGLDIVGAAQVAPRRGRVQLSLKRAGGSSRVARGQHQDSAFGRGAEAGAIAVGGARAALLPDLEASVTDRNQTESWRPWGSRSWCPFRTSSSPPFVRPLQYHGRGALRLPRACSTSVQITFPGVEGGGLAAARSDDR